MTIVRWAILFAVLIFAMPAEAVRKPQTASLAPETLRQIEAIVETERVKEKIPGLSIAIASGNRVVFAKGFGLADVEHSVPATPETVYRTASIAKSMTATAVMQLVEQGKLDLDAPIQKYCPAFPEKPWRVTARQLLGHLGGIRHYKSNRESSGTQHFDTIVSSLAIFKDEPLLHEPGTKYSYTTYGYSVLGCAIEGASGKSYAEYMQERIFQPAGMSQTGIDNFRRIIPHRARGYAILNAAGFLQLSEAERRIVKPGEIFNASLHDTSMKVPGGGLVSTAGDLARFAIAINTLALVNQKTRLEMWTTQKTRDGQATGYGLGWEVKGEGERMLVSHSGGQAGTSTLLTMMPSKGTIIAVMANLQGAGLGNMVGQIGRLLVPEQAPSQ
jgi:CubicO group peptidase (beta-lactamase class C family)